MSNLLFLGVFGLLTLADPPPATVTNAPPPAAIVATNSVPVSPKKQAPDPDPNDPVEKRYLQLIVDDNKAQGEVDDWIRENNTFQEKGAGVPREILNNRIFARFAPIRQAYDEFLRQYPDHARAHIAYGSFLNDIREVDAAEAEWEKARQIDPTNPAAWNNLANHYGHEGPVKKAFEYYQKAIELDPDEAVYYQNMATTVFLFRKEAMEYYHIEEQQVFDKALALYAQSLQHDPTNFVVAQDYAQTYYGIRPERTEDALKAWTNAFKIATTDEEREGVQIHFARLKLHQARFAEARKHLQQVSNPIYEALKTRLTKNLELAEAEVRTGNTNHHSVKLSIPATTSPPNSSPPVTPPPAPPQP